MPNRKDFKKWDGGYIREGVFYIYRKVRGRLYERSTRCTTKAGAASQLAKFEADPVNYRPDEPEGDRLVLDTDLIAEFASYSRKKGNTEHWVANQEGYLAWWAEQFDGRDLRKLDLGRDIVGTASGVDGEAHKIRVVKSLYGWLRKAVHRISPADDPTFGKLKSPTSVASKKDKIIPFETYRAVRAELPSIAEGAQPFREGYDLLAGTGWHVSELVRFAQGGDVRDAPVGGILVCPRSKRRREKRTSVSSAVAQAARLILEHGTFDVRTFYERIHDAAKRLGLKDVPLPGQFRHTAATWAIERGWSKEQVATWLDHLSSQTTMNFYAKHAVAPKPPTII